MMHSFEREEREEQAFEALAKIEDGRAVEIAPIESGDEGAFTLLVIRKDGTCARVDGRIIDGRFFSEFSRFQRLFVPASEAIFLRWQE